MRVPRVPLVYIAAPYTHPDPVENTNRVCRLATKLVESGLVTPVVPHMSLVWHLITPRPVDFWYDYDLRLLERCDGLLRLRGESVGADGEVAYATDRGIPVFTTASDLYAWAAWPLEARDLLPMTEEQVDWVREQRDEI